MVRDSSRYTDSLKIYVLVVIEEEMHDSVLSSNLKRHERDVFIGQLEESSDYGM
jgi:hypothetical protein